MGAKLRWLACVALGFPALAAAQVPAGRLPPGAGSEIVAVACVQCHGTGPFTQMRVGVNGWRLQVYDMILRGAQVKPDEVEGVATYLAANFGFGQPLPATGAPVTLAEGPGRDLVAQRCTLCHGLDRVAAARRKAPEWQAIVARMAQLGTPLSVDETRQASSYLASRYGAP